MSPLSAPETAPRNQDRQVLAQAVAAINRSGLWPGVSLKVHFDMPAQRLTVQFVNNETDQILDQIPSEEALRIALELAGQGNAAP
jgi:uncharacterized FlaG/YvyC family protein